MAICYIFKFETKWFLQNSSMKQWSKFYASFCLLRYHRIFKILVYDDLLSLFNKVTDHDRFWLKICTGASSVMFVVDALLQVVSRAVGWCMNPQA